MNTSSKQTLHRVLRRGDGRGAERPWQKQGLYSDDTQMVIAVANALLAADLDDPDSIMHRTTVLTAANASKSDTTDRGKGRCDSDSIACVAGGISGAHDGVAAIPGDWAETVENHDVLTDIGMRLAARAVPASP